MMMLEPYMIMLAKSYMKELRGENKTKRWMK